MSHVYGAKVTFTTDDDKIVLNVNGAVHDTIQIQLHPVGTPGVGDTLEVHGYDEDGDTFPLVDELGNASPFNLSGVKLRRFKWKGPRVKLVYNEAGGGTSSLIAKVKVFEEGAVYDDTRFQYTAANYTAFAAAVTDANAKRDCKGGV